MPKGIDSFITIGIIEPSQQTTLLNKGKQMELKTTLNGAQVTVQYEVDFSEVDCYDRATGSDYTKTVMDVTVESVMFMGVDIVTVISEADMTALEMECTAAYDEVAA